MSELALELADPLPAETPLTEAEKVHLVILLRDPVLQKHLSHLQNLNGRAALFMPLADLGDKDKLHQYIVRHAYTKGIISCCESLKLTAAQQLPKESA